MTSFSEMHQTTVTEFLSGVVIIDDKINFTTDKDDMKTTTPVGSGPATTKQTVGEGSVAPAEAIDDTLYANDIIKDFSEAGIHCVTKEWGDTEKGQALPKLAEKSDIVVVDWQMGDTGEEATRLIKDLIKANSDEFKYIVIYTAEPEKAFKGIQGTEFEGLVKKATGTNIFDFTITDEINIAHRIQIIEKDGDQSGLCNQIIEGFAEFSEGFLRNAALNGLTSIRKNTFKLLSIYPKELDKSAISHFTNLQASKEAFDHAELFFRDYIGNLISDNLKDIVTYSNGIKNSVNKETILKYLKNESELYFLNKNKKAEQRDISEFFNAKSFTDYCTEFEKFSILKTDGKEISEKDKSKLKSGTLKFLKEGKLSISIEDEEKNLEAFSINDCTRDRMLFSNEPILNFPLKFGVIIKGPKIEPKEGGDGEDYFLCLQPLCDSVRLTNSTNFIFIKLDSNKNKVDFIVKDGAKQLSLSTSSMPHKVLKLIEFEPISKTGDVRTNEQKIFEAKDKTQYTWLAELKENYTQTVAHTLFSNGTRIGMDKFEWLRQK